MAASGSDGGVGARERASARSARLGERPRPRRPTRRPFTFVLDEQLVERARTEVGEGDVVRSIEAALAAALDYQLWVREVSAGERSLLS